MSAPGAAFLREALFNGNGIAKKLILALVLFSSLITTVITAAELYYEYRRDLRQIDSAFEFVGRSYLPTLEDSVWVSDAVQVQSQLDGLLNLPDIEYIAVRVDGRPRWAAGREVSVRTRVSEAPLLHEHRGQHDRRSARYAWSPAWTACWTGCGTTCWWCSSPMRSRRSWWPCSCCWCSSGWSRGIW
ncbi:MAG: hypothetical protein U5L03_14425 [Burkholderiaceae bacterium]|nr:hypothetical protein [Burkholderiaceae bacterium]